MATPKTIPDFLELLRQSQLLSAPLLEKLEPQIAALSNRVNTPKRLAQVLCKNKVLSVYQSVQLLKGRSEGFYLGKFKILELLGRGGMGKVYLVEHIALHKLMALKVMRNNVKSKADVLARFLREARAVAALQHPNIIQAHDYDEIDGVPYIVMDFIEGINAEYQQNTFGNLPYAQAADYIMQAAAGLQHAHEMSLVHRDVKPGNLLIDCNGNVKLLDLGLVSSLKDSHKENLTDCGDQLGTLDYISPEQALNSSEVDIRTDIYSLGAVFYHLVTGSPLFPNRSASQKLLSLQADQPASMRSKVPDLPAELERIIMKMLAKKPADRFQTPAEAERALRPFAERQYPPYPAHAIPFTYKKLKSLLRRSPTLSKITTESAPEDSTVNRIANSQDSSAGYPIINLNMPVPARDPAEVPVGDSFPGTQTGLSDVELSTASKAELPAVVPETQPAPIPQPVVETRSSSRLWLVALILGMMCLGLGYWIYGDQLSLRAGEETRQSENP